MDRVLLKRFSLVAIRAGQLTSGSFCTEKPIRVMWTVTGVEPDDGVYERIDR